MRLMLTLLAITLISGPGFAAETDACAKLPAYDVFKTALKQARGDDNGGLNLDMWGALVARDGQVCAVAYTGDAVDAQWPGSRLIAAQKAYTANAFSLKGLALATANLYSGVQPGGFLYGIQHSNPINTGVAYEGPSSAFGSAEDPLIGKTLGGINVFGGGLALYNADGAIIGAVGVSGDTSCADHNIAWRARHVLQLDYVPGGVAKDKTDNIIYDIASGRSKGGFGHPACGNKEDAIAKTVLPKMAASAAAPKP